MFNQLMQIPKDDVKLVIGGDHSTTIATGSAFLAQNENPGIIVIDAHADLNTSHTSPSGNVHGMTFAKLMGYDKFGWMNDIPNLSPRNIAFIGTRDVDQGEIELMEKLGIVAWSSDYVNKTSFSSVVNEALMYLSCCDEILVSFDVDVLSPRYITGTGTKVSNGLDLDDVLNGMPLFWHHESVKQFEVVEFNPDLCEGNRKSTESYDIINIITHAVANDVLRKCPI